MLGGAAGVPRVGAGVGESRSFVGALRALRRDKVSVNIRGLVIKGTERLRERGAVRGKVREGGVHAFFEAVVKSEGFRRSGLGLLDRFGNGFNIGFSAALTFKLSEVRTNFKNKSLTTLPTSSTHTRENCHSA